MIAKLTSALAGLVLIACSAVAAEVPAQAEWADAKRLVDLPNGQRIAVVELGPADAPPVVLIHGMTDNSRSWSLIAPHLADRFRLIAVDLRGHGKSSAPQCCYGLREMAYDVALTMDALGIEKASVVGHSLGSMAAQVLAARWPERVERLVLMSSTTSMGPVSARDGWLWQSIGALQDPIDPKSQFMIDWYTNPNPVDPDFLGREMAESAAVPVRVWKGILDEAATSEFGRYLPDVKAPVLILHGGKDGFFGEADQTALKAALPAASFKAFPELGHNMQWEEPQAVAAALAGFLAPGG